MRKERSVYHALFTKKTALKIACVIIFAMFANIMNLSVIAAAVNYQSGMDKYTVQIENKIGKIYKVVNLPVHIMNELFKQEFFSNGADEKEPSNKSLPYALLIPAKKTVKRSGDLTLGALASPFGNGNKLASKINQLPPGSMHEPGSCIFGYLESNDIVRYMLLFLILISVLPRGIPVKIKKIINRKFAFPVFIAYKAGIFHFIMECKGRVK